MGLRSGKGVTFHTVVGCDERDRDREREIERYRQRGRAREL